MGKEKLATLEEGAVTTIQIKDKTVSVAELLSQMENAQAGQELTSEYLKLEPGEETRVILMEMTKMSGFGDNSHEQKDAVSVIGSGGVKQICGDAVMVSTARILANKGLLPRPVLVTCKGMIKSGNGEYRDLKIRDLLM